MIHARATMQNNAVGDGEIDENSHPLLQGSHPSVDLQNLASATRSGRRRKVEEDAASSNYEMISRKIAFAGRERALQEGELVTPKPLSRGSEISSPKILGVSNWSKEISNRAFDGGDASCSPRLCGMSNLALSCPKPAPKPVDYADTGCLGGHTEMNIHRKTPLRDDLETVMEEGEHGVPSGGSRIDENPSLTPDNEEAAMSPSPEKSGNWRLNAVLEAFGNLSPTREGRVKTLVRAFESLLSATERKGEQQACKSRCPLKFSYLSSNANLDGEENAQREDFTDGEDATDEEERVGQWQNNLSEGDVEDEETDDRWQSPHTVRVYSQSVVEDKEKDEMGDQLLPKQEFIESREEIVSDEREDGMENVLQKQEAQEDNVQSVEDAVDKGGIGEQSQLPVLVSDEKQWQSLEAEHSLHDGLRNEEVGEMKNLSQKQEDQGMLAHSAVEEDAQEEDKKEEPAEEQSEVVYTLTLEKGDETDKRDKQPSDIVSIESLKKVWIEGEAEKDSALQELETRHVPNLSVKPMVAAFKRQPPNQAIRTNLQKRSSQKFIDGYFASIAARKQKSSRSRESLRGSNCSISSTRPPLTQNSQTQSAQDKPRFSKPQPFKLLTEARGHMKEQEFMMRLRKILEEEEKLRVPLAQGLPWTTDEPEILHKPPVKENTKPLDVHLNSDLRAMERAEFDRFIAEKLLYIEERRLEEERIRRVVEEEEVKKMRQDMVPKAQLMPYFDRPFRPRRSSKRPTIPKEPQFQLNKQQQQPKRQKCVANST